MSVRAMTVRCGHARHLGGGFGHAVGLSPGFRRAGVGCPLDARLRDVPADFSCAGWPSERSVRFRSRGTGRERSLGESGGVSGQAPATNLLGWPGWRLGAKLTLLEEEMLAAAVAGELVDRGEGAFALGDMQAWGKERTVRAAVLRYLLIDERWPVDAKGVWLRGVRISGHLDLDGAALRCPLSLESCYLDAPEPVSLEMANASGVMMARCHLAGLSGAMLTAKHLDLSRSILSGPIELGSANIAGYLTCSGAELTSRSEDGNALDGNGIRVGGDVFLREGFTASGTVRLAGADIRGQLACRGAKLTGRGEDGYALAGDGIKVGGDVFLDEGFTASGTVRLLGGDIAGQLNCGGARLTGRGESDYALDCDRIKVGGHMFLTKASTTSGAVRLLGADIAGQLNCHGARLAGRASLGDALVGDGITVGDDVNLDEGFTASGTVRLRSADITGLLNCRGAKLTGSDKDGNALVGNWMKADSVFLDEGFTASGAVRLAGADIKGHLSCRGAKLTGSDKDGDALVGDGTRVGGYVFLDEGFTAAGAVSLASAHVGGSIIVGPAGLAGEKETALYAAGAQIAGALRWVPAGHVRGHVNLEGAAAAQLEDEWTPAVTRANGCWPVGGRLHLDGFTYGRLGGNQQATVGQRLTWIRSQYLRSDRGWLGFATQPYEQLAAVYRHAGQDTQARKVAIARRADLRKYGNLNAYRWAGNWLLDKTIKYGYQAWRAAVGLAIVFVAFLVMSVFAQHNHVIVPVGNLVGVHPVPVANQCTSSYPCFYPAGYAIDVVIPIINVHQADHWGLDGHAPGGWIWVADSWVATGLGWALVTLLVAGYTGLVRRQ